MVLKNIMQDLSMVKTFYHHSVEQIHINILCFLSQTAAGVAYLDKPSSQHPYTSSGHSYKTI